MPENTFDSLLCEQIAYYRARAGEYDEWFLRQGRYDRGSELNHRPVDPDSVLFEGIAPQGIFI